MFDADYFKRMHENHDHQNDEFRKLYLDQCSAIPKPGDRVIVAAGFLGHGHLWIRVECTVLEVASTSYKVYYKDPQGGFTWQEWVHPALITDVILATEKTA